MRLYKLLPCLLLLLTSCATAQKPALTFSPGSRLETLSTAVSLSVRSAAGSVSGNGVMVYQRPDRIHLVVLSPFGTTMLEAFAHGEQLMLVYPSKGVAYSGRFDELPDSSGMQGWQLMRWVMDAEPADQSGNNGSVNRALAPGVRETINYESGVVTSKVTSNGNQVFYRDYELVGGVPLARELEIISSRADRIRLKLEEPEVNATLDPTAFTPRLDGITVLPLSEMPVK